MSAYQIPIANVYYLLCYAWDRLEQGSLVDISRIVGTELVDLFAIVLVRGIEHIARRGFERGYNSEEGELRGVRGRVDILATNRRFLLEHGRAACVFDELTTDTLPNQILKATLKALAKDPAIDPINREAVLRIARRCGNVQDITITTQSFRCIQLTGNNRVYRFLLNVCELIHGSWLTSEEAGPYRFRAFLRDERRMAYVFQYFVFNFLRIERSDIAVFREHLSWKARSGDDPKLALLPQLQTDISVLINNRKVIIDTKYYRETLSTHYDKQTIHAEHLYQMLSYLFNSTEDGTTIEGILLYPTVGKSVNSSYTILGMPVRIQTLDLARPWNEIHDELMRLPN
jgi:5-methylcytosine-specific restriction enzyme subunit McrC